MSKLFVFLVFRLELIFSARKKVVLQVFTSNVLKRRNKPLE